MIAKIKTAYLALSRNYSRLIIYTERCLNAFFLLNFTNTSATYLVVGLFYIHLNLLIIELMEIVMCNFSIFKLAGGLGQNHVRTAYLAKAIPLPFAFTCIKHH